MGLVAEECDKWGMPLLAMMDVRDGSRDHEFDGEKIAHAARVAEELGADLVKVNYSGSEESFKQVINGVKIPVLIAGGEKMTSDEAILTMIKESIQAGVKGVSIGRNVFQHKDATSLSMKIRKILDQE